MRIAIVNFSSGGLSGGYKKYLNRVVPLMEFDSRIEHLDVFIPIEIGQISKGKVRWHLLPKWNDIKVASWLKSHLPKLNPDVVFIPTARWINFNGIPTVIMVRNMEPLLDPFKVSSIKECLKNIGRYVSALKACKRANRIIAVSNHVREFLIKKWRINPHRIGIVYHGVDVSEKSSDILIPESINGNKISRFIFTAGSIRPARGLEDLIKTMKYLKDMYPDLNLIIAGKTSRETESYKHHLNKLAIKLGVRERILWVGHLNENEMIWCYQNCSVFIMTSRVEACPNIALEAMSHGCICLSAYDHCLPEIFRDAAMYYPPKDGKALSGAIQTVLKWEDTQRKIMSEKARNRASEFSWDVCARKTVMELAKATENFKSDR